MKFGRLQVSKDFDRPARQAPLKLRRPDRRHPRQNREAGTSLLETLMVMTIVLVLATMAIPASENVRKSYKMGVAVASISGAIQGTRYQSIMRGCSYTVAFTQNGSTYQVAAQTLSGTPPSCSAGFTNVGGTIPWTSGGDVNLTSPSTTLQLNPNGMVSATNGSLTMTLSNGATTRTITVSGVGNVTVSIP
jgi:Tfp pilus assembly protein FimT